MNDDVLSALRAIRAIDVEDGADLPRRLLDVLVSAMACGHVRLLLLPASEEISVGTANASSLARLELRLPRRAGAAVFTLERASPFLADDERVAELLGGEIVLRVDHARAEREASRLDRQIGLLHALTRAGADAQRVPEVADRAALELLRAFEGAHVAVHVLVEDHLELVARRTESRSSMDTAPEWLREVPLDADLVMAVAARTRRLVNRPICELLEPRRQILEGIGLHHLLVVPLLFHDAVFGTIALAHGRDTPWDAELIRLLEGAAAQLGVELAHVRLLEAERRRAEDLGLINELGSLVAQQTELPAVLSTAVNELARITGVPRVHLFLADADRTVLTGVACTEERDANMSVPVTSSAAVAHAYHRHEPIVVNDAAADPRTDKGLVAKTGARAILAVPLMSGGEAIGAIALVDVRGPRTFTATEVARAVAVANLVSPAVANAKMFDDLRRSYEALGRTQAEVVTHERLAALGELSAVIAHEVRNPLAIIFNSLGSLRRIEPKNDEAKLLLDIVGEEAARLNRIVGDLLDFVRPYTPHPREVQLAAIVNGAVEAARRAAPNASVEVRTELNLSSNEAFLDGTMLQQALINLIVNAVQATPQGSVVTVRATAETLANETRLRFDVVDDGPGLDAADAARVFQPFYTTKATGTGLGLAVVRRIADALGGGVEVTRAPSGGAVFTLTVLVAVDAR